jgi:hypothetical protein
MSLLCPFSFPPGAWCRPAFGVSCGWVLWLPPGSALPLGFSPWFLQAGGFMHQSAPLSGSVALLLVCPAWLGSALAAAVPAPVSHGSRTHGVLLPW